MNKTLAGLFGCWAALLAGGVMSRDLTAASPNVVVILADDLGFSDLGCYGGEIDTPHLDSLAAGGLRFTQGYNTARCWPTRAALLTGYYPQAIRRDALPGGKGGNTGVRPPWARLLPRLLAPAGYRSYHSGKWHVDGDPRSQGFARSLDVASGESNYFAADGIVDDGGQVPITEDFYATTSIGDHAVKCLADHARDHAGTPFFHYIPFTAPHFPLQAPPELIAKYRDRYRAGWNAVQEARVARLRDMGIVTTPPAAMERNVGPPYDHAEAFTILGQGEVHRPVPWAELTPEQREFQIGKMAIHAAMVEIMDRQIGRILSQLRSMGVFDDTLVLFASDNGASAEIMVRGEGHDPLAPPGSRKTFLCLGPGWSSCANTPFRRHKMWVHEGGIATPWIVHWPAGISARGGLRRQPVHVIDVAPTVLEVAGIAPPTEHEGRPVPPMHGRSFVRILGDGAAPPVHDTLWWCHGANRAVRAGDWKLVAAKGEPWELYDLAKDRCETTNLAASDPVRVAELESAWTRVAEACRTLAADDDQPVKKRSAAHERKRPNIIYVMTDDQGYGDLAAHGNPVLRTPNLDRLHRESVRFTEFHASPTCSPTRAALMTGRHEFRSGVTHTIHERERLALSATTLPQLLKTAGYASGIFGKWHLGDEDAYQPGRRGFDRVFIHGGGGIGQSFPGSCGDAPGNSYLNPVIRSDGTFVKTEGYCTDVFFDAAIDWIDTCREEGKPFFCYVAPNAPHAPLDCPAGSDTPYLAKLEAAGVKEPRQRADIANFYGMIENIDMNLGRLLRKLDAWGLADDTLVVFTTDNGTATGAPVFDDGMRGTKGTVYRGGTRVPSLWRWPGTLPAGVDATAVTAHIDVLPTLCELAGVVIPAGTAAKVEGRSLVPLLRDAKAPWPDRPLVAHLGRWDRGKAAESGHRQCRIREGNWSLVNQKNGTDSWELYDVAADPGERHDLALRHPDIVARLSAAYDGWWQSVQPDLVNEHVEGPAENPFKVASERQFGPRSTKVLPSGRLPQPAAADPRPNIVLFLADDLGYGELGCYGNAAAITPNLDRFAAKGLRLTDCHSAGSVCSPSRSALLTGRTPYRNGVFTWIPEGSPIHLRTSEVALPNLLREAGYDTCHVGKWHLNGRFNSPDQPQPSDHGYAWWLATQNTAAPSHAFPTNFVRNGSPVGKADEYSAPFIANEAIRWLKERRDPQKPFFLAVWTHEPHYPIASAERYDNLHAGTADREERTYRANVTQLDDAFGQLMKTLDDLQLADSTLVFFSSDNGPEGDGDKGPGRGLAGGLRGRKRSMYEGGHRVPGLVRWPGTIQAGTESSTPVIGSDFFPTVLAVTGLEPPAGRQLDGTNLLPLLAGGDCQRQVPLYWRWGGKVAYREGNRKIVVDEALEKPELYDLAADRSETSDLAGREPELLAAMMTRLRAYTAAVEAEGPDWWRTEPMNGRTRATSERGNGRE